MTTRISHHPTCRRFSNAIALAALLTMSLAAIPAPCQSPPQPTPPAQTAPVAQATPAPQTEFEVASVRMVSPHGVDDLQRGIGLSSFSPFPTNLFTARFTPLSVIIQIAYGVDGNKVSGGPDWLNSQEYDINAKVEGDAGLTREQMQPLLQHLLEERFHLTTHREQKIVAGYELVAAKSGPKLRPGKEGVEPHGQLQPGYLQSWHSTVQSFAQFLAIPAGRPVIDKTAIEGTYDFDLHYAPANDPNSDLPDFFTAVQEQLGLKLVPQKVPVETLVIDHVDKIPTEN